MIKPIMEFETQEELNACLAEWQQRLFLTDWLIKAKVCEPDEFILDNVDGENDMLFENSEALIRILNPVHCPNDAITKYCAELILVHELLHCKYNWLVCDGKYEGKYVDAMEHKLLEQMAKSLIMAKYNLDFQWFLRSEGGGAIEQTQLET